MLDLTELYVKELYYYIYNSKKFTITTATHVKDEKDYLEMLLNRVKRGEKFVFSADTRCIARAFRTK
jgi:hypothetical protein